MADFFRVQFGIVSRSDGHSAAKRSAYQSCARSVGHDGQEFDFSRKRKEHVLNLMLAPEGAPSWTREPDSLWQRVAEAEKRIDAQEARIVDFSMPRAIQSELWEACIRHVYAPFLDRGMVFQIDIHDTRASDGGRNINVHGLAILRPIDGDGFAKRKDRTWNELFRERSGRNVREQFADRLTAFCHEHGIEYEGDARSNAERDLPAPEPQLPKWNFEAFARTNQMPDALAALHEHRRMRRQWEAAKAEEIEAALELDRLETRLRTQRRRRIVPSDHDLRSSSSKDRHAAILRAWHDGDWIDANEVQAITSVRFDQKRDLLWIELADGTTLVDRGDAITMQGNVTWSAALETAVAAERHGWQSVEVTGDQAYKDAVSMACLLRGIEVTNHTLTPKAQAAFDRLLADQQPDCSINPNEMGADLDETRTGDAALPAPPLSRPSSRDIHLALAKRISIVDAPSMEPSDPELPIPAYKPSFS